ncbi:MAG: ATP synthase F1 subunit delta [Pelagibacteraceae bacterium]
MENQSNSFSDTTGRYAKSIFQFSQEKGILNEVENDFIKINDCFKNSQDFKKFVTNPTVKKTARLKIIENLSQKLNFNIFFTNFLKLINEKGRFFFLERIVKDFFSILSINKGEIIAELIMANEISDEKKEEIKKDLSNIYKKDIKLNFIIDESLITGSILKVGSKMIDNSAKSKFNKILNNI